MQKCLYCGENTEGFFCEKGGITIGISNTGEKSATKSYCYNDFLTILKLTNTLEAEYSPEEKEYMKWKVQIEEWYKNIQYIKYESPYIPVKEE